MLDLLSDEPRWLLATDPGRTDLLMSCGAVLHHARVAFAGLGWSTSVHYALDTHSPELLATLEFMRTVANPSVMSLSEAITRRQSNRAPYGPREVPDGLGEILCRVGREQGAMVARIGDEHVGRYFEAALADAESVRRKNEYYRHDPADRTAVRGTAGVCAADLSFLPPTDCLYRQPLQHGSVTTPPGHERDASSFLLVGTAHGDIASKLRAGEAASAILLQATTLGLATCLLSLPVEGSATRQYLRRALFNDAGHPFLIVRIGWAPIDQRAQPMTPRLPIAAIFDPGQ